MSRWSLGWSAQGTKERTVAAAAAAIVAAAAAVLARTIVGPARVSLLWRAALLRRSLAGVATKVARLLLRLRLSLRLRLRGRG